MLTVLSMTRRTCLRRLRHDGLVHFLCLSVHVVWFELITAATHVTLSLCVQIEELPKIVSDLSGGLQSWENVVNNYPAFEQQETG